MNPIDRRAPDTLVGLTAGIVAAYVKRHVVPTQELAALISGVHAALGKAAEPQTAEAMPTPEDLKPAVSIRKSVTDEFIICLEDGKKFKSLKRHLASHYNLTPDEYRAKWGLPETYPMVAPAYAEQRSRLARENGLGQSRKPTPAPDAED